MYDIRSSSLCYYTRRVTIKAAKIRKEGVYLRSYQMMGADAKVDLEKVRSPSITYIPFLLTYPPERISYQPTAITALSTVIEKTRGLAFCTQALGAVMNRRLRETEGPWKAMKMEKEGRGRGGDCGCG